MPPASSRSGAAATAAAGQAKSAAASKKSVQVKNNAKRKSIATDPALLQGSSDEELEGPEDHEEEQEHASRATTGKHANGSQTTSKGTSRSANTQAATKPTTSKASPRRSTRLSGEGAEASQQQRPTATSGKDNPSQASRNSKSASTNSSSQYAAPNKRKAAPTSTSAANNAIASGHPTPPETDSDTANGRTNTSSQKRGAIQSQSPTSKAAKKPKIDSGDSRQKTRRAPSPPPSDGSDESDNFAFTRVADGNTGAVASSSKQKMTETASQPLPARTKPSSDKPLSTSQSQPVAKGRATSKAKAHAQVASSDLLQSLKEVRQNGSRRPAAGSATAETSAQPKEQAAVVDRKGKRKAEESAGEEQEEQSPVTGSTSQSGKATQSTVKSTKAKLKKGRVAELSREDEDEPQHQPDQPPDPGTPARSSKNVPINTQETPAIQRNLAMRAGLGNGAAPGTPGSSRRSSGDMRGRRGSSIGNGLEALPHPSLPSNTLYRHIKADDPQPVRFRTLITWAAHRLKESMESETRTASAAVRAAASSVMDSLIADLVEKRIDLSWQAVDPADDQSTKKLPPNPENEANQAKLEACQSWIQRLQEEDKARNLRINQYKAMTESITKLMTPLPPLPASSTSDPSSSSATIPDLLQPNWSLSIPRFKDKNDMLAYGKKLLQPKPSTASTRRKSAAAAAASSTEDNADSNVIKVQDEYPVDYEEIKHQAASMAQSSYRINQFLKLADTFVMQHLARTQIQLGQITGASSSSLSSASKSGNGSAGGATQATSASEQEASSTTRALLAGNAGQPKNRGQDAMSLLRAISRADTTSKKK